VHALDRSAIVTGEGLDILVYLTIIFNYKGYTACYAEGNEHGLF
jgi:hypothetical protein